MPSEHRPFNSVCLPTTEFSSPENNVNQSFWESRWKKKHFDLIALKLCFFFSFLSNQFWCWGLSVKTLPSLNAFFCFLSFRCETSPFPWLFVVSMPRRQTRRRVYWRRKSHVHKEQFGGIFGRHKPEMILLGSLVLRRFVICLPSHPSLLAALQAVARSRRGPLGTWAAQDEMTVSDILDSTRLKQQSRKIRQKGRSAWTCVLCAVIP